MVIQVFTSKTNMKLKAIDLTSICHARIEWIVNQRSKLAFNFDSRFREMNYLDEIDNA